MKLMALVATSGQSMNWAQVSSTARFTASWPCSTAAGRGVTGPECAQEGIRWHGRQDCALLASPTRLPASGPCQAAPAWQVGQQHAAAP